MTPPPSLSLGLPLPAAVDAVAATLSEQGFDTRLVASQLLEVSRPPATSDDAAGRHPAVRFEVRFSMDQDATGEATTVATFDGADAAPVPAGIVRAAARVAEARLAQQGLVTGAPPAVGPDPDHDGAEAADVVDGDVPASAPAEVSAVPHRGESGPDASATGELDLDPAAVPGASSPAPQPEGARAPAAGSPPTRTNDIAIVAIVLGFLSPLVGVAAGVVGLAQIRRTGERGRGLALAGIVVGSVVGVAMVVAGVVAGPLLVERLSPAIGAASSSPAPTATRGGLDVAEGAATTSPDDSFDVTVGQCFHSPAGASLGRGDLVSCADPHTYEVYARFDVAGDAFPGADAVTAAAEQGCVTAFGEFVGLAYDDSGLDYVYVAPTRRSWRADERAVACLIVDPAGEVAGSLAHARR